MCRSSVSYLKVCADVQCLQSFFVLFFWCVCVFVTKFSMLCLYKLRQAIWISHKWPIPESKCSFILRVGIISVVLSRLIVTGRKHIAAKTASEESVSNKKNPKPLIVTLGFAPTGSEPGLQLHSAAVKCHLSLVCSRHTSIMNVSCSVSFCFFYMYIYAAFRSQCSVTGCRRQSRYLFTDQTFNKSSKSGSDVWLSFKI